jgi:hypothetical protein
VFVRSNEEAVVTLDPLYLDARFRILESMVDAWFGAGSRIQDP